MPSLEYPLKPTNLKLRLSIRVSLQSMRLREEKQLEAANALYMCSVYSSSLTVSILNDLKAYDDLDERYDGIGSQFRRLGASCLGGVESACEAIKVFCVRLGKQF